MQFKLVNVIEGYELSRNYIQLVALMKKASVICISEYYKENDGHLHVARTIYSQGVFQISSRDTTFIHSDTERFFIDQCQKYNVQFIVPGEEKKGPQVKTLCAESADPRQLNWQDDRRPALVGA